jgi:hypothetical protein
MVPADVEAVASEYLTAVGKLAKCREAADAAISAFVVEVRRVERDIYSAMCES